MKDDELQQALLRQRIANQSTDPIQIIGDLYGVDPDVVARLIFAAALSNETGVWDQRFVWSWERRISANMRQNIQQAMRLEWVRLRCAEFVVSGEPVAWPTNTLLADDPANIPKICNGCPVRLECMAESISTPYKCATENKAYLPVRLVKMTKTHVTVEAEQPTGTYELPFSKLVHERIFK